MIKAYLNRKAPRIPFTQAGYDKILAEKKDLESQRPEAVENLKKAREMGDLSENGYYKASRQRLSFIDARLRRVSRLISLAKIVSASDDGTIQIGSRVTMTLGSKDIDYSIVGGYESDPSQKTISYLSPLGRALLGKKAGDTISVQAPAGNITYVIRSVQ